MSKLTHHALKSGAPTEFLLRAIKAAVDEAREKHPQPYVDVHHMLGVLDEEVHELKMEGYKKRPDMEKVQTELLQIAAVALRGIEDITLKQKETR